MLKNDYIIHFYDEEQPPEVVEKLYITREQADLLMLFEEGEDLGWELLSSKQARRVDEGTRLFEINDRAAM